MNVGMEFWAGEINLGLGRNLVLVKSNLIPIVLAECTVHLGFQHLQILTLFWFLYSFVNITVTVN